MCLQLALLCTLGCLAAFPAFADERVNLQVLVAEEGYGRLEIEFSNRLDLPAYTVRSENNVLAVSFEEPIDVVLPDISGILHDFVAVARIDPDRKGLRFGLKPNVIISRLEAGERVFFDFLPSTWRGLPPSLPDNVIAELEDRAEHAALLAERRRKARLAELIKPEVTVTVGRHSTFVRLQFDWTIETEASFMSGEEGTSEIAFEWPVPVDLFGLQSDLPVEISSVASVQTPDGTRVALNTLEGVAPRFYEMSPSSYVIDIDRLNAEPTGIEAADLLASMEDAPEQIAASGFEAGASADMQATRSDQVSVRPFASEVGATVRLVFPFEDETAAAVYRRGDAIWMVFDTPVVVNAPERNAALGAVADEFTVMSTGDVQIVRMMLADERLATLGSEGPSWVLSLGDVLLTPAEPIELDRQEGPDGRFEVVADLRRPARVHQLRDTQVGDVLDVVTVYPPARGIVRDLRYVDFTALQSVHGFVIKPQHDDVRVALLGSAAIISAENGLRVSAPDQARGSDSLESAMLRVGFMDLVSLEERDPEVLYERLNELMGEAAQSDNLLQAGARLQLAKFLIANRFAYEAVGLLGLLETELETHELDVDLRIARAAADTLVGRSAEALDRLETEDMSDAVDALVWRTIARTDSGDFAGARTDALVALSAIGNYPEWLQAKFDLAAMRAAVEQGDTRLAEQVAAEVDTANMDALQAGTFHLLTARIDESEGRIETALDKYGRLIAQDLRPVRAEAIFRTLELLDRMNRLDAERAADLLAGVVMTWRGNDLEFDMLSMLSDLYFRSGSYRLGFESAREASEFHGDSDAIVDMVDRARIEFVDLFLNGRADILEPVEALGIYYDFRQLTPAGARGDEMIRNLARRLIRSDLLGQAAELLAYQVESRLEGAARAQIATDLAIVFLANRQPEEALTVLHQTRMENLPSGLERQRRIVEARALIDAGRNELAIDLLAGVEGRDASVLRVDAHWKGRRFREAAELLEVLYAPESAGDSLSRAARMSIIKAAVGYVLADDRIGLGRLRSKFEQLIAESPEWPMFQLVTGVIHSDSVEFREIAREVAGLDTLGAFLTVYRERYGGQGALTPDAAGEAATNV